MKASLADKLARPRRAAQELTPCCFATSARHGKLQGLAHEHPHVRQGPISGRLPGQSTSSTTATDRQLEYDFVVAPGADPRRHRAGIFEGADGAAVDASEGDLVLQTARRGAAPAQAPRLPGRRRRQAGGPAAEYVLRGRARGGLPGGRVRQDKPLIIDPVPGLLHLPRRQRRGRRQRHRRRRHRNLRGGLTVSADFPTAGPPFQGAIAADYDAYVTKLNPAGLGADLLHLPRRQQHRLRAGPGRGRLRATPMSPVSRRPPIFRRAGTPYQGSTAAVSTASSRSSTPPGSSLLYSTYLGGTSNDFGLAVAVDASGNAYVAGRTDSTDFPTAGTPFQSSNAGAPDAFVAKLNPSASRARRRSSTRRISAAAARTARTASSWTARATPP